VRVRRCRYACIYAAVKHMAKLKAAADPAYKKFERVRREQSLIPCPRVKLVYLYWYFALQ
jgi:hypothetical protein